MVRADDASIKSEADLAGKKIGAQIGTTGAIYVTDKLKDAELKQYDTPDLAMMDLLNKNIDAVIVDTRRGELCAAGRPVRRANW